MLSFLNNVLLLIFLLIFIIAFTFIFWRINSVKYLKNDVIFDISIITTLLAIFFGRLVAYISNISSNINLSWSILPVASIDDKTVWFKTLPWQLFDFSDLQFSYIGLILGILIGMLFLYIQSNKKKSLLAVLDRIIIAAIFSLIFVVWGIDFLKIDTGRILASNSGLFGLMGFTIFPVALIRISTILIIMIFYLINRKKNRSEGRLSSLFLLILGISEAYIASQLNGYTSEVLGMLNIYQVFCFSVILVGLLFFLNSIPPIKRTALNTGSIPRRNFIQNKNNISPASFSLSFANNKNNNALSGDLTKKEKFTKTINSFKRKIAK